MTTTTTTTQDEEGNWITRTEDMDFCEEVNAAMEHAIVYGKVEDIAKECNAQTQNIIQNIDSLSKYQLLTIISSLLGGMHKYGRMWRRSLTQSHVESVQGMIDFKKRMDEDSPGTLNESWDDLLT